MARPTKHNADYFSHDNSMRNDIKIKSLRRKYGHTGYSIWNMLIELLTSQEYFEYEWTEFNIEMLSADFDIDTDELESIVEYCTKLGLLQITNNFLHCDKLTFRLEEDVLKRRTNYCSNNAKRNQLKGVNVNNNSMNEDIMNTITPLKNINEDINTQSKVKKSRVKDSRVKDSRVKDSRVNESKVRVIDYESIFDKSINEKKPYEAIEVIGLINQYGSWKQYFLDNNIGLSVVDNYKKCFHNINNATGQTLQLNFNN